MRMQSEPGCLFSTGAGSGQWLQIADHISFTGNPEGKCGGIFTLAFLKKIRFIFIANSNVQRGGETKGEDFP